MEQLIERAKRLVEHWYNCRQGERPWLEAEPPYSYDNPEYKVKLLVLEGSPPKGYILVDYSYRMVKLFGVRFFKSKTLRLDI